MIQAYEGTMAYRLIYAFSIHDEKHSGHLKIGETTFDSGLSYKQLPPNCDTLNNAARKRIDQYTKTAMIPYNLEYTTLARRKTKLADGTEEWALFSDHDVHVVLTNSGIYPKTFAYTDQDSEWFPVDLPTTIKAIDAVRAGRNTLSQEELGDAVQYDLFGNPIASGDSQAKKSTGITLRDEQVACVAKTERAFKTYDTMLWDCKMRFGKTVTAYELIRRMDFKRVLVVTHRPVVEDGWRNDFKLIFTDDRTFLTKERSAAEDRFDAEDSRIDRENDQNLRNYRKQGKKFIYFASVQDLRGSKKSGGKFDKNHAVFDMDWDLVVYDEAHEGLQTERGKKLQALLESEKHGVKPKILKLSGTPYNIRHEYDDEENVYSWDYVMEQKRKKEWDTLHPGDHNPYAELPELRILTFDLTKNLPNSYRFETMDSAFNFSEFFRTWTGDTKKDFRPLPEGVAVGDFVHGDDVQSFLNLISTEDENSSYPFSTQEYRNMFRHTLWMVPGVKEARALSTMLQQHPVFSKYAVANVAGEGDAEVPYDDALKLVRKTISKNPYTITISCGKLTTGVTVREWSAVMMLSGSSSTAASGYMQTIFRVQSAGTIDGKVKERAYVFDFAPDRALRVLREVHQIKTLGRSGDDAAKAELGEFLNFCPVIAVSGTGMVEYDVPKMMREIKRITVDNAIKTGFDDESVYKIDTGIVMNNEDAKLFKQLMEKLTPQKKQKKVTTVQLAKNGMTDEEYDKAQIAKKKKKKELTEEEKALLEKEKKAKKQRGALIDLLRNVSIRLPMLIYGAAVDLTEAIRMQDFVELVDNESWKEFMPKDVDKKFFLKILRFYDEDVVMGAGLRIRRMARAADELPPTQRTMRIAEIFSYFRSPDHETVLTPWRVVNMHMSDILGGYCFYEKNFDERNGVLEEPRFVKRGDVTTNLFGNKDSKILEMNSKSGLYPLYVAYCFYRLYLNDNENSYSQEQLQKIWQRALRENVFVLCKTKMARQITERTLKGYQSWESNVIYLPHLLDSMDKDQARLARKISNPNTWGLEGERLKFTGIVGNPPYQSDTGGGSAEHVAARQAKPVFQLFVEQAKQVKPNYLSMIMPARWYAGGIGLTDFRQEMLHDKHITKMVDFINSRDCFTSVDIAGGICYFLWELDKEQTCEVTNAVGNERTTVTRELDEYGDIFIRSNKAVSIVDKVKSETVEFLDTQVYSLDAFGFPSAARGQSENFEGCLTLIHSKGIGYIKASDVKKNQDIIDKYKVTIGILVPCNGEVGIDPSKGYKAITTPRILKPGEVITFSYLVLGAFDTEMEALNFANYMTGKFARFMLRLTYSSMHIAKANFILVPKLDYTKAWSDAELYKKYNLTQDEINLIETTIRPMSTQETIAGFEPEDEE